MSRLIWKKGKLTLRGRTLLRTVHRKYAPPSSPSLFLDRLAEKIQHSGADVSRIGLNERLIENREELIQKIHSRNSPPAQKVRQLIAFLDLDLEIMETRIAELKKTKKECQDALVAVARAGIVQNEDTLQFFQLVTKRREAVDKIIRENNQNIKTVTRERKWLRIVVKHALTRAQHLEKNELNEGILNFFISRPRIKQRLMRMRSPARRTAS